jgi:hypothetical protein
MVFNSTFNNISVISWRSILLVEETGLGQKKIYVCLLSHVKKIYGQSFGINFFLIFFLLSTKPEIVVPGSAIRFQYLIFENSGKMTNYAVFLPSLLSISTKS